MPRKTKKVAIFVDGEFIPSFSGASNRFHYLTRALQNFTDTSAIVLLCDRGWSDIKSMRKESFKTYLIHPSKFKNIPLLAEIIKREKVDIIQFGNLELAIEIGIPLSDITGTHLIFEAHYDDYEFAKSLGASKKSLNKIADLQKTFGKYFDAVFTLSSEDIHLAKRLKISAHKLKIVPSGVSLQDFPKNCFNPKTKKIIFFGNLFFGVNREGLNKIKNIIYKNLRTPGYKFHIIGDVPPNLKKKMEEKDFIFLGKQKNLDKAFAHSSISLAPLASGTGTRIKILNYLSAGIPVITTSEGAQGFPKKELLIIENDVDRYDKIIEKLIQNHRMLTNLSKKGRMFVRENFSWENVANVIAQEYTRILNKDQKKKVRATLQIQKLKFDEPAWVKDVIKHKRFRRNKPYLKANQCIILSKNRKELL